MQDRFHSMQKLVVSLVWNVKREHSHCCFVINTKVQVVVCAKVPAWWIIPTAMRSAVPLTDMRIAVPIQTLMLLPNSDGLQPKSGIKALSGKRPVFTKIPMPLIWEPVDFWKKYYAHLGETSPFFV